MLFIDSEGEPVQEFSAIYVHNETYEILDVFHRYVVYPSIAYDCDTFARHHVHGLSTSFLSKHGLRDEDELLCEFNKWLLSHPCDIIYANAPSKEEGLLNMSIMDIRLKPWKERCLLPSHRSALSMKLNSIPISDTVCHAHSSFRGWKPKKGDCISPTDSAKIAFSYHCSLYDSIECLLFYIECK